MKTYAFDAGSKYDADLNLADVNLHGEQRKNICDSDLQRHVPTHCGS